MLDNNLPFAECLSQRIVRKYFLRNKQKISASIIRQLQSKPGFKVVQTKLRHKSYYLLRKYWNGDYMNVSIADNDEKERKKEIMANKENK